MDIKKVLIANRGEIAIRISRACNELGIGTVAVYTFEDRYSLHRYKTDEAYQIGLDTEPLKPYLDIEAIIGMAKECGADAIHPGYGFLSENAAFARRCAAEGIIFIGPSPVVMEMLGDKVRAKEVAQRAGVPIIQSSDKDLDGTAEALAEARRIGYPLMLKAAAGGGGRGMRVVRNDADLEMTFASARNEALKAFGDGTVFLERFIENPRHIEVQVVGDQHGNVVHLYERDCSVPESSGSGTRRKPGRRNEGYTVCLCDGHCKTGGVRQRRNGGVFGGCYGRGVFHRGKSTHPG